jgi:hypothetical protein
MGKYLNEGETMQEFIDNCLADLRNPNFHLYSLMYKAVIVSFLTSGGLLLDESLIPTRRNLAR